MSKMSEKDIEEFIDEHSKHSKRFLSGVSASSDTWRVRCAECYSDYIVDIPEELSNDEAIDMTVELDDLVDRLCKERKLECECLGWV